MKSSEWRVVGRIPQFACTLWEQRAVAAQEPRGGDPLPIAPLESILLVVDRNVIEVNLAHDAPALTELDRVLDFWRCERVVRIRPGEKPLVVPENPSPVSDEVDAEFALVKISLNAQPTVDSSNPRFKRGGAALRTPSKLRLLPIATGQARLRVRETLIDLQDCGNLLCRGA